MRLSAFAGLFREEAGFIVLLLLFSYSLSYSFVQSFLQKPFVFPEKNCSNV